MDFSIDRHKGKRTKDSRILKYFLINSFIHFLALTYADCTPTNLHETDPVWNIRHILPTLNMKNDSVTDVFYNVGDNAFLPCRFPQYSRHHEGSVSWIRRWDWQILTAGVYTNTNDDRFAVLHREGSDDWTLQIKYVQIIDNGTYDCQVHTGTGFLSQFVNLHIVEPQAKIVGGSEIHVSSGESFTLTCVIEKMISPPVYVMWLHKNTPLNYAPDKPRLTVKTIPKGIHTTSTINVILVRYDDSGNYTCTAPNAKSASVMVYVTEGDAVAAIQRIEAITSSGDMPKSQHFIHILVAYFITIAIKLLFVTMNNQMENR